MKPADWDQLPEGDRKKIGIQLLNSTRGAYIIAQALAVASKSMKGKPIRQREVSNIQDMEILLETLFSTYAGIL